MTINFIIVDDRKLVLNSTVKYIERIINEENMDAKIVLSTTNPQDAADYSNRHFEEINVYVLDINFNSESDGITLARAIRENEPNSYIIFITAFIQYSMLTFKYKLKAFDYLIKPVSFNDMKECIMALEKECSKIISNNISTHIHMIKVKSGYQEYEVAADEIIYIESFGPKLVLHLRESVIETYSTFKYLENDTNKGDNHFYRCHKSYLVNLKQISQVELNKNELVMSNGDRCPISRTQRNFFREYLRKNISKRG